MVFDASLISGLGSRSRTTGTCQVTSFAGISFALGFMRLGAEQKKEFSKKIMYATPELIKYGVDTARVGVGYPCSSAAILKVDLGKLISTLRRWCFEKVYTRQYK